MYASQSRMEDLHIIQIASDGGVVLSCIYRYIYSHHFMHNLGERVQERFNTCPKSFGKRERCADLELMVTDRLANTEKVGEKVEERPVVTNACVHTKTDGHT